MSHSWYLPTHLSDRGPSVVRVASESRKTDLCSLDRPRGGTHYESSCKETVRETKIVQTAIQETLCNRYNKTGITICMRNTADGQTEIKACLSKPVKTSTYCVLVIYLSSTSCSFCVKVQNSLNENCSGGGV